MHTSQRIAFFSQGAKNWVAGTIYIHNLVRALHYLPEDQRPQLHTFLGPAQNDRADAELGALKPRTHYYCCRATDSKQEKVRQAFLSLLQGRSPASLEKLVLQLKPSVLFPVQGWSLGKDFPAPWIGWIPDFQHKHLPQFFNEQEQQERDRTYEKLIAECGHLVLSSEESRKDLMRWYGAPAHKVSVLPFRSVATPQWFAGDPMKTVAEFQLPAKYLMFPCQFWVHKNHLTVFKALALLKKRGQAGINLVCTGFTQDYRRPEHFPMLVKFIKDNDIDGNIRILGLLPRQKQIHLMRAAAAIVQPSLFEGWSSLVEDSRTLGKPLFLSDIPIHREQNPDRVFFFPPENSEELADLIARRWDSLTAAGQAAEQDAYNAQVQRAREFAQCFLQIAAKVS